MLKYLIPVILAAITLIAGADESGSRVPTSPAYDTTSDIAFYSYDSFTPESDLYLPRQTSSANIFHSSNATKRTNTAHKNPFVFLKAGKVTLTGIHNFIHKESLIIHSSLIKPAHRLISLGKLII